MQVHGSALISQMQQDRDARMAAHKSTNAATASSTSTTASTDQAAFKIDIQVKISDATKSAATTQASTTATTAADKYGSFYKTSPNGDKLAQLRAANEARVKDKVTASGVTG